MDIKITGIDVEHVSKPRNDGTEGSGLYRVPLKLSSRPSPQWAQMFPLVWDHPPQFTTMHRPGIARVIGDQIVLDGTTIEEVRDYHLDTLKLVLPEVSRKVDEMDARGKAERDRKDAEERAHEEHVREVASKVEFDK